MTSLPAPQPSSALLAGAHPLGELPPEALRALEPEVRTVVLPAGAPLRPGWGGADALAFVLEGGVEWVSATPGRAAAPARAAGPGRAFLVRQAQEEGAHPLVARTALESRVAWLPLDALETAAARDPVLAAALARLARRDALACMHAVLGTLDDALLDDLERLSEWVTLRRGEVLCEQGSASDGLYFVISGRLKAVRREEDAAQRTLGSIGPGEPAGEVAFFTGGLRGARVLATRATTLVRLSDTAFDQLAARRPRLARTVARAVVERSQSHAAAALATATVVLLPAGDRLPAGVAAGMAAALGTLGPTLALDRAAADARTGGGASAPEGSAPGERADAWLEAAEAAHRFLLLEADPAPTEWTLRCLRQADQVVVFAAAAGDPAPGPVERLLERARGVTEAAVRLVLIHPETTDVPSGTRRWLAPRPWLAAHHHVRRGEAAGLGRVAREIAGRSVGVVLGGGGARGFAHIGILRALTEAGVPVDRIGGTSMGASMAAQWALGWGADRMMAMNRRVWVEIRPHKVLTLPVVSILGTAKAHMVGRMMYGDTELEDLWIPFFCVSSSLTRAAPVVHRTGSLLWACTASASLPGIAAPVLMGGELLVDGALLNNVPADVMRADGAGVVIAAEVSPENERVFTCERVPTAWEALRNRWRGTRFPSIPEMMLRASMLHSIGREREIASMVDLFLHPPVDQFPMMDFSFLDAVAAAGYAHARAEVAEWLAAHPELLPAGG